MLADVRRRAARHNSKGRWRLWPCLALGVLLPAVFASVAQAETNTFSNPNPVAIPGTGTGPSNANPYPSTIRLGNFNGNITDVNVRLENLAHTWPGDIDALLVGPTGQSTFLMSDTGGSDDVNVDLTFDDGAGTSLPLIGPILSGTYRPTNLDDPPLGGGDSFPAPAPPAPFGTTLGGFNNTSPNGDWRLFIRDDVSNDFGSLAGGWSLSITTPLNETPTGQATTGAGHRHLRRGNCANGQRGSRGRDVLNGTRRGDRLSGGRGNDVLRGRRGNDCLSGGSGNDRLSGGSGKDRLSGGSGKDKLKGGSGKDRFSAGSGRDSINSRDGRRETVRCGSGRDKVRADGFDRLIGCERVL